MPTVIKKNVPILLNLSNIHSGGALQVAISFVSEIITLSSLDFPIKILVSDEIVAALDQQLVETSKLDIEVFNTFGLSTLWSKMNTLQRNYSVVFTLFGPKYTLFKAPIDIVGFAQFWILQFDNPISQNISVVRKYILKSKFYIQKKFFMRSDLLIVELEHVKKALSEKGIYFQEKIEVVHNTISNLYFKPHLWQDFHLDKNQDEISIGYVCRDHPHKNISILSDVAKNLNEDFNIPLVFYFTLTDAEWRRHSTKFGKFGKSVGALNVYQCPSFYENMDAVIFPSLLECFSAAPLEALVMKKPLFASKRNFVTDICGDHAIYFDPLSSASITQCIASYFLGVQMCNDQLDQARSHALNFSNATQRANAYLQIIKKYSER